MSGAAGAGSVAGDALQLLTTCLYLLSIGPQGRPPHALLAELYLGRFKFPQLVPKRKVYLGPKEVSLRYIARRNVQGPNWTFVHTNQQQKMSFRPARWLSGYRHLLPSFTTRVPPEDSRGRGTDSTGCSLKARDGGSHL